VRGYRGRASAAVDQQQTTQGPKRLPAKVLAAFLVKDRDGLATCNQFIGGHKSRQTRTDDDNVALHCAILATCLARQARAVL
jgi:hypothetical protein